MEETMEKADLMQHPHRDDEGFLLCRCGCHERLYTAGAIARLTDQYVLSHDGKQIMRWGNGFATIKIEHLDVVSRPDNTMTKLEQLKQQLIELRDSDPATALLLYQYQRDVLGFRGRW
jgi:hypothetical protein